MRLFITQKKMANVDYVFHGIDLGKILNLPSRTSSENKKYHPSDHYSIPTTHVAKFYDIAASLQQFFAVS
jgi:hypothetical protein